MRVVDSANENPLPGAAPGRPEHVKIHDFIDPDDPKAITTPTALPYTAVGRSLDETAQRGVDWCSAGTCAYLFRKGEEANRTASMVEGTLRAARAGEDKRRCVWSKEKRSLRSAMWS